MTPEVIKDVDTDTASAAQTQLLQQWTTDAKKGVLAGSLGLPQSKAKKIQPPEDVHDDWGMHNPDRLGWPESKPGAPKPVKEKKPATSENPTKPAKAAPPAEQPATPPPVPAQPEQPKEPTTNFSPAKPSGE